MFSTGLDPAFVREFKDKQVPFGPVGLIVQKRTYARLIENEGRTEDWYESCARACNGIVEIGGLFSQLELEDLYRTLFYLKGSTSGRALWQLGTGTVRRLGADSLVNCWFSRIGEIDDFCFTFNQLMLGGGVGFSVSAANVYELPRIKQDVTVKRVDSADCNLIVTDNREGWIELLRKTLESFFVTGKSFTFSTQCVRSKGCPIKTFGGTASGPEDLVKGILQIVSIMQSRSGQKLRPIDCTDLQNLVGQIVVSGNVRRSAEIALGDPDDIPFLHAKNWGRGPIPNWRSMSNNSAMADSLADLSPHFWETYEGNSECYGLINLRNLRRFGRLADGPDYRPDYSIEGVNPCAEIGLAHRECCNLADVFLPRLTSLEEFKRTAYLLYKVCKTISCYGFSDPQTQAIVDENHRLGIGVTGFMQANWTADEFTEVYRHLEAADLYYSDQMGVGRSIKLTTVKPSGTLSLLPGVTPGAHPAFARHMIRRIRFAANDPLVETCRRHGYHVEPKRELDGSPDTSTMVVSFPIEQPGVTEDQVNVIDQLNNQRFLQTYWSDNAVSITNYFKPGELPLVKEWLAANYEDGVKTCSFLPSTDHGFQQAPLEKITAEQFAYMSIRIRPITTLTDYEQRDLESMECAGGACPVK